MDATLVLQHMDDGNLNVTTCDKDTKDTEWRNPEKHHTCYVCKASSQQLYENSSLV